MSIHMHTTPRPRLAEGEVPPTPTTDEEADGMLDSMQQPLKNFLEVALRYGMVFGYKQEQDGRIIQHIFPKRKNETSQISGSSKVELELHTEAAFHPYKPDYVALLCVRADPDAATVYASLDSILRYLAPSSFSALCKSDFVTRVDASFQTKGEPDQEVVMPVFTTVAGELAMTFDADLMSGTHPAANVALEDLRMAAAKAAREVVLRAGDIIIIDNNKAVHGRRPFTPKYDGKDRWLLRALLHKNPPPQEETNRGVITTTNFSKVSV